MPVTDRGTQQIRKMIFHLIIHVNQLQLACISLAVSQPMKYNQTVWVYNTFNKTTVTGFHMLDKHIYEY